MKTVTVDPTKALDAASKVPKGGMFAPAAFGFVGVIFLYAGWKGRSVVDVLRGTVHPSDPNLPFVHLSDPHAASGPSADTNPSAGQPTGITKFDGMPVASAALPFLNYARLHGWKGKLTSGYRSKQTQAGLTGAGPIAAPGKSRHQGNNNPPGDWAIDVSEMASFNSIINGPKSPLRGKLKWRAAEGDPVHFSPPVSVPGKGY